MVYGISEIHCDICDERISPVHAVFLTQHSAICSSCAKEQYEKCLKLEQYITKMQAILDTNPERRVTA